MSCRQVGNYLTWRSITWCDGFGRYFLMSEVLAIISSNASAVSLYFSRSLVIQQSVMGHFWCKNSSLPSVNGSQIYLPTVNTTMVRRFDDVFCFSPYELASMLGISAILNFGLKQIVLFMSDITHIRCVQKPISCFNYSTVSARSKNEYKKEKWTSKIHVFEETVRFFSSACVHDDHNKTYINIKTNLPVLRGVSTARSLFRNSKRQHKNKFEQQRNGASCIARWDTPTVMAACYRQ